MNIETKQDTIPENLKSANILSNLPTRWEASRWKNAIMAIMEHWPSQVGQGDSILTLLGDVNRMITSVVSEGFRYHALLLTVDTHIHGDIKYGLDIMTSAVAKSCMIAEYNIADTATRHHIYICPTDLFVRLNIYRDIDDCENEHQLPKLTGSARQIDWARVLRYNRIRDIEIKNAELRKENQQINRELYSILKNQSKAHWWIENRNYEFEPLLDLLAREMVSAQRAEEALINWERDQRSNPLQSIIDVVQRYKNKHPKFKDDLSIEQIKKQPKDWLEWACVQPMSILIPIFKKIATGKENKEHSDSNITRH